MNKEVSSLLVCYASSFSLPRRNICSWLDSVCFSNSSRSLFLLPKSGRFLIKYFTQFMPFVVICYIDELSTDKPKPPAMRFNLVPLLPTRHSSRRRTFSQSLQCAWPCGVEKILYLNLKISVFYIFRASARLGVLVLTHITSDATSPSTRVILILKRNVFLYHSIQTRRGRVFEASSFYDYREDGKLFFRPNREEGAKKTRVFHSWCQIVGIFPPSVPSLDDRRLFTRDALPTMLHHSEAAKNVLLILKICCQK